MKNVSDPIEELAEKLFIEMIGAVLSSPQSNLMENKLAENDAKTIYEHLASESYRYAAAFNKEKQKQAKTT